MRGRKKLFILVALLSAILIISVVFSSGVVDVLRLSLGSSSTTGGEAAILSTPTVFVDPGTIIKDYENDPGYQIGDTFEVHVNITGAIDLFAWQVNMNWNPSILNVSDIIAGEFLNVGAAPNYTSSSASPNGVGFVVNKTDNATGYTAMGESILGADTGVSGDGRLVTIEFQVVGYGCSNLTLDVGGNLPTTLLNSTIINGALSSMEFTKTNGYFKNKINGDANGDGAVNVLDVAKVNSFWSPPGPYSRCVDTNDDGAVNVLDVAMVNSNWGRNVPI